MLDTFPIRTEDMPREMRVLLDDHPRETWAAHPGFRAKTRQWLSAHQMFRQTAKQVRTDAEAYLDRDLDGMAFAERLNVYGGALLRNLHGHHGWEDRVFFPELSTADPRFEVGLEILEQDHADLDLVLDRFGRTANRVILMTGMGADEARDAAGDVQDTATVIEAFLARHLEDEEDLAVPIILNHRLRG